MSHRLRRLCQPAVAGLFLAPVLGEWLSTATPPLDLLLWPPALVLLVSLYGCGALLCREIARRSGLRDSRTFTTKMDAEA